MKKLLAILIVFLFSFNTAFAAWVATEDFESYTIGDAINGKSGGSGWNGNWVGQASVTVQASPTGFQGANALKLAAGTTPNPARAVSSISTSFVVSFITQVSGTTSSNPYEIYIYQVGVSQRIYFRIETDGNIKAYNAHTSSFQTLQAYSANTAYTFVIDYDSSTGDYSVAINGGAPTTGIGIIGGAGVAITGVDLQNGSTGVDAWFDFIRNPATPATPLTSIIGLVRSFWIF